MASSTPPPTQVLLQHWTSKSQGSLSAMQSGRDGKCDALGEDEGLEDGIPLGVWLSDSLGASLVLRDGSCDTVETSEGSADGPPLGVYLGDTLCVPLGPKDGSYD